MRKTGKSTPVAAVFYAALLLLLLPASVFAQQADVEATVSESKIFTGEQVTLSIEIKSSVSHDVQLPVLPDFDGFRLLSNNPSRSTSLSIVNNRTTRTTSYSYTLVALEPGNYRIPPINIIVDGESRTTSPIPVEIIEKGSLSAEGRSQLPDIFVQIEIDDEQPVAGQQLIASVVVYFKEGVELTSFQPAFGWQTDGFWKEELENISQPRAESTILNGVRYRTATLLRYALFPSRGGELTLSEYGLRLGVRTQPRRNDPFGSFFGGAGTNQRRISVESEPVKVNVQSLPSLPSDAIGMNAVGDLTISRSINTNSIQTGESIELKTTVEGTGNIPLVRSPEYSVPDGFDRFTPRENSDVERRGMNIRGKKTFTEFLVSRAPGNYTLPEERIAIFDPSTKRYNTVILPAIDFEVRSAPVTPIAATSSSSALQPVTGLAVWHNTSQRPVYQTAWFWIFFLIPLVAVSVSWWRKHLQDKLLNDLTFRRKHFSYTTARERIQNAENFLAEDRTKDVYRELHKAVSGYITDKLGLPESGLSDQELLNIIEQNNVNGTVSKPLKKLLDKCNTISYAPTADKEDIQDDIRKTETLIKNLSQKL